MKKKAKKRITLLVGVLTTAVVCVLVGWHWNCALGRRKRFWEVVL